MMEIVSCVIRDDGDKSYVIRNDVDSKLYLTKIKWIVLLIIICVSLVMFTIAY